MNDEQLEHLVQCFGVDILRFCRITAGNREDGDELYQDTMVLLLEKRDHLDPQQNVKAYAVSAALKLWKGRTRKLARRLRLVPQESLNQAIEEGPLVLQTCSSGRSRRRVRSERGHPQGWCQ